MSVPIGRRGVGEVRLEDDDPAAPLERADAGRRAAGGAGGVGERRAARRRRARARADPSRRRGLGRARRRPAAVRAVGRGAVADRGARRGRAARRRPRRRGSTRGPADRDAAAQRPGGDGASVGRVAAPPPAGRARPRRPSRPRRRCPARRLGRTGRRRGPTTPWRSSRAAAIGRRVARADGRRRARRPARRSGGAARSRAAARRRGPSRRRSAPCPPVRRSTNRSPGATAIGAASRRIAAADPSGRSSASRPLRPTLASTAAVPRWSRARARSGQRRGEPDEEPVAGDDRRVVGQDEAAMQVARLDAGQVERRPPGPARLDGRAVDLDLADPDGPVARHEPERACPRPAARPRSVPVTTTPRPLTAKTRSIGEARAAATAAAPPGSTTRSRSVDERRAQRRRSRPRPRTTRRAPASRRATSRRAAAGSPRRPRPSAPAPATSAFVTTATPCRIAERVEQREVLDRLGARPVVGGHDEHRRVDLAGADEHVADQPVVARDVDEVELGAVGERQVGVADVDRHPAPPLLGQPVGVDPGQRPEQRRLAVVDVPGGPDDDGHRGQRRAAQGRRRARPRARHRRRGSTVRRSSTTASVLDPADDRPAARARSDAASVRPPSGPRRERRTTAASRRAATPPPTVDVERNDRRPPRRSGTPPTSRSARTAQLRRPAPRSSARRGSRLVARARPVQAERRRDGGQRHLVRPHRRAPAGRAGSGRSGRARPTISPACGPPTSLSPLNVTRSAPAASRSDGIGSWASPNALGRSSAPRPEVVDDDRAVLVGEPRELGRVGRLDEPGLREVRRVDAQHDRRPARRRAAPRSRPRASGSSSRPRSSRAPARRMISGMRTPPPISTSSPRETTTPASPGQPDGESQRRGVVVRDQRVLGTGQGDEVLLGRAEPRPAAAGLAVELEQRVAGRRAAAASIAARGHGARPRFVWRITPVALMTVRRPLRGRRTPSSRPRTASARSSSVRGRLAGVEPAPARRRLTSRAAAAERRRVVLEPRRAAGRGQQRSTLGGRGRSVDIDPPWRERVGVEPTAPRRAPRHWF